MEFFESLRGSHDVWPIQVQDAFDQADSHLRGVQLDIDSEFVFVRNFSASSVFQPARSQLH